MKQRLVPVLVLCSVAALAQPCAAPTTRAALLGAALLASPTLGTPREVHRNKDDRRRMRLTKEKVQHVERAIRYADYGDGYARLERQWHWHSLRCWQQNSSSTATPAINMYGRALSRLCCPSLPCRARPV
jgi:hypothetical protein